MVAAPPASNGNGVLKEGAVVSHAVELGAPYEEPLAEDHKEWALHVPAAQVWPGVRLRRPPAWGCRGVHLAGGQRLAG